MDSEIYYCENCGGVMEFDAASQSLKCPNCGTELQIKNERDRIVEHSLTRHAMQTIRATEKKSQTMICKGCGAKIEVAAASTATTCPYCGSKYVLAEKQEDAIVPDGVLPFQVERKRVGELFYKWLKGRWLAPGELKRLYQQEKLQGIYLPYWTFDAKADAHYTALGGRRRTITRKTRDGKTVRETVVDWYPTSGVVRQFFDDILVPASGNLKKNLLDRVGSFGLGQVVSYSPEYFSGYNAEIYTVDLDDAHRDARQTMEAELQNMARQDVLRHYDEVRDVRVRSNFEQETYKHVMLPIYATAYTYKDKKYHVLINGQSGRVEGDYPKSPAKILAIILGILAILLAVLWFSSDSRAAYETGAGTEIAETEEMAEKPYGNLQKDNEEAPIWDCLADSLPM